LRNLSHFVISGISEYVRQVVAKGQQITPEQIEKEYQQKVKGKYFYLDNDFKSQTV
jgi:hypothetical protein